jgi:hypothetical protein
MRTGRIIDKQEADSDQRKRDSILVMSQLNWRICGGLTLGVIIVASLLLPTKLEQLRTGHWAIEHFLAYFAAMFIVYRGWPQPFVVAGGLIALAALLEALQGLKPDHIPNVLAALSSIGGVFAAAPLAVFLTRVRDEASAR